MQLSGENQTIAIPSGVYHNVATAKSSDAINDLDATLFYIPFGHETRVPAKSRITAYTQTTSGTEHAIGIHFDSEARILGPAPFSIHEKAYKTKKQRSHVGLPNKNVTAAALLVPAIAIWILANRSGSFIAGTIGTILGAMGVLSTVTGSKFSSGIPRYFIAPDISILNVTHSGSPILGFSK